MEKSKAESTSALPPLGTPSACSALGFPASMGTQTYQGKKTVDTELAEPAASRHRLNTKDKSRAGARRSQESLLGIWQSSFLGTQTYQGKAPSTPSLGTPSACSALGFPASMGTQTYQGKAPSTPSLGTPSACSALGFPASMGTQTYQGKAPSTPSLGTPSACSALGFPASMGTQTYQGKAPSHPPWERRAPARHWAFQRPWAHRRIRAKHSRHRAD